MTNDHFNEIEDGISQELLNKNSDILIDYGDVLLKNIFNNEVIKEIPVIKTIAAVSKTGLAIKERYFATKLINFLNTYRLGNIDHSELDNFIIKMEDTNYKSKVVETIMIYLDRYTDIQKATLFSKAFIGYINNNFNWDKFILFCSCIDLILISDLKILIAAASTINADNGIDNGIAAENIGTMRRLENIGFLISEGYYGMVYGVSPVTTLYKISADGDLFLQTIND